MDQRKWKNTEWINLHNEPIRDLRLTQWRLSASTRHAVRTSISCSESAEILYTTDFKNGVNITIIPKTKYRACVIVMEIRSCKDITATF